MPWQRAWQRLFPLSVVTLFSASPVYCRHGDLARAIAARCCIEVFAIVKDMLDRGERPIQARVQKILNADSLKAPRTLRRCLNEAIRPIPPHIRPIFSLDYLSPVLLVY